MKEQKIFIFDTTLRDGQQCPGAGMSLEENMEYAKLAKAVGVDILEAGFPSASSLDFDIVRRISSMYAEEASSPIVAGLCQLRSEQVDITINALEPLIATKRARLHVYLPVDPNLMHASLGHYADNKKQLIADVYQMIKQAHDAGLEVEFSPEGYSRMGDNSDFTSEVILSAVDAGARIINCPDTIGGACQREGESYFVNHMQAHADLVKKHYPDEEIIWSMHCHNDFGLALENSMNGVFHGPARQIEGCFNGIGERAGNVALEQCIMYLEKFGEDKEQGVRYVTGANVGRIQNVSDFLSSRMLPRQPHWPVTGENASKHTSGGHTNAILSNPLAYQPFDPEAVGQSISFVFGPLSGSNHAKMLIEKHGYVCGKEEKAEIAQFVKDFYSERRKGITDSELITAYIAYRAPMNIDAFDYQRSHSEVTLELTGKFFDQKGKTEVTIHGEDSPLAALNKVVVENIPDIELTNYSSEALGKGIDAKSHSRITVSYHGRFFMGEGLDSDIEISALKALVDAANQAWVATHFVSDIEGIISAG